MTSLLGFTALALLFGSPIEAIARAEALAARQRAYHERSIQRIAGETTLDKETYRRLRPGLWIEWTPLTDADIRVRGRVLQIDGAQIVVGALVNDCERATTIYCSVGATICILSFLEVFAVGAR